MTPSDAAPSPAAYYDAMADKHRRLAEEIKFALRDAIESEDIKTHTISARVKEKSSYLEKIERKGYDDPLAQIEDVVGVRIVCLFTSDLPRLKKIVQQVFLVLSEEDKVEGGATDSFGYMSIHYICKLNEDNSGPRYKGLGTIKFEVQCRTILMDAWANVSHYLAYKGEASIPEPLRRDFHALAGLFYVADKHFELFFQDSKGAEKDAVRAVAQVNAGQHGPVQINRDTVRAFLTAFYPDRDACDLETASDFAQELAAVGYTTVEELEKDLKSASAAVLVYERDHPPHETPNYAAVGLARQALSIAREKFAIGRYGSDNLNGGTFADEFAKYRHLLTAVDPTGARAREN